MKRSIKGFRIPVLISCLATACALQGASVVDNFNTPRNYLTQGIAGTIWDGVYFGAGEFQNSGIGGAAGTTLMMTNVPAAGHLAVQTRATDWEAGNNDGFFLYKTVAGDFQAVLRVVAPFDATSFNSAGLMARAADPGGAAFGGSEDYVGWFRFDQFGFGNYGRNTVNGGSQNVNPGDGVGGDTYWIMLERVGNMFNTYSSPVGPDDPNFFGWNPSSNANFERQDLAGQPMQVGIMQATFSDNTPVTYFASFSLTNASLGLPAPAAATGLTMTATPEGALNLAWTPGAGSEGSLVIMRRNGTITRQPSVGVSYTANTIFGSGDSLGKDTYVVYAGNGNSATVQPTPGDYTAAVYAYSGTGASRTYRLTSVPTATATVVPTLSSISLTVPSNLVLFGGAQAVVSALYANGAMVDVTSQASFSSGNAAIIGVSAAGFVTGNAHGSSTVTATFNGKTDTKNITVGDPAAATLIHRYSFNEAQGVMTATDSIGGANATLVEQGGSGSGFDGSGQLNLENIGSGNGGNVNFVELPANILKTLDSVTFETWVTDKGTPTWGRVFDFGNSYGGAGTSSGGSNYIFMGMTGTALRSAYGYDPYEIWFEASKPPQNEKVHLALTMYAPAKLGLMYINGKLAGVFNNMVIPGTTLPATPAAMGDTPNNWLGRSQYNDPGFTGSYDEFRIYNGSLSALQILVNSVAGPNQVVTPGALQSLAIAVESTNMKKAGTQQSTVTGNFANINGVPLTTFPGVAYTSSDSSVVAVDAAGKLTSFNKIGTAKITASYGGQQAAVDVTVVPFDTTGFAKNMQISFSGYAQSETLSNFPALITLGSTVSGFNYSQFLSPDAADLRFTDSEGTELNYEIEKWDITGTSFIWVQVPRLSKGTQITAYWGKAGQAVPSYRNSGAAWSDGFTAVWHMTTNRVVDASGNGYNATAIVDDYVVTDVNGLIGTAQHYDGVTGNGTTSVGNIKPGPKATFSSWVFLNEQNREGIFMAKDGNVFFWQQGTNLRHELAPWGTDTVIGISAGGGAAPSPGAWFHIAGTVEGESLDSTVQRIYINGQLRGTWTKKVDPMNNNSWTLGGVPGGRRMFGILDECRVESVTRSASWLWACWKNQSAPMEFATYTAVYSTTDPLAVTLPQAAQSSSGVTISARVVSDGGTPVTSWGTVWGTTPAPTGNSEQITGSARAPFSFSQVRSGFNPATLYYFRAWASNAVAGKVYTADGQFLTKPLPASAVSFADIYNNQMTISWAPSAGVAGYLVVMKPGSAIAAGPNDGVTYTANASFGLGQDIGGGAYAVYSGTGTSVTVKSLAIATTYYVSVYAIAGTGALTSYSVPAEAVQATAAAATSSYPNVLKNSNPLAVWPLYDVSGTAVTDLMGAYPGSYTGAVGLGQPGPQPGSLSVRVSGGASARIPWSANLNPSGPFTVEGWFKPATAGGGLICPISSGNFGDPRSGWLIYQDVPGWNLRTYFNSGLATSLNITSTNGAPVAGQWTHLAVVYDGNLGAKLYVNGQLGNAGTASAFVPGVSGPFVIGARADGAFGWDGWASGVAMYNRALTEAEIQSHFADQGLPLMVNISPTANGQIRLEWSTGSLVESTTVDGTYTAVQGATSPYIVNPAGSQKFYRVRN